MLDNYERLLEKNKTLLTSRLVLRPFQEIDCDDIFEYASDEITVKYLTFPAHTSKEQSLNAIHTFFSNPGVFAITLQSTGKCIGCFDLRMDAPNDKASFGYVLNRDYWNQGYMTEALNAVLQLCFETLDLNRVESTHYVGNEGSGMVMKKCGMKQEGLGIQEVLVKGIYFDVVHYAIFKKDWTQK